MSDQNNLQINTYLSGLERIARRKPKKPIILFFGRNNFSDNSKYLFLHMSSCKDVVAIWCSVNHELCKRLSEQGLHALNISENLGNVLSIFVQASVVVHCVNSFESVSDLVLRTALKGAVHVQLWHGISIKPLDMMLSSPVSLLNISWVTQVLGATSLDVVLSPSDQLDDFWCEAFGARQIIRAGLPRNEVLLRPATEAERINTLQDCGVQLLQDRRYILWVPTFTTEGTIPWWNRQDVIISLAAASAMSGHHLVIKPHPYDMKKFSSHEKIHMDNVSFISPDVDIYPELHRFSCLITDRSSLMFDYLHLNRPILILENSQKSQQPPVVWFDHLPVPAVCGADMNAGALLEQCLTNDQMADARSKCLQALFQTNALQSCETIGKVLVNIVQEKTKNKVKIL